MSLKTEVSDKLKFEVMMVLDEMFSGHQHFYNSFWGLTVCTKCHHFAPDTRPQNIHVTVDLEKKWANHHKSLGLITWEPRPSCTKYSANLPSRCWQTSQNKWKLWRPWHCRKSQRIREVLRIICQKITDAFTKFQGHPFRNSCNISAWTKVVLRGQIHAAWTTIN